MTSYIYPKGSASTGGLTPEQQAQITQAIEAVATEKTERMAGDDALQTQLNTVKDAQNWAQQEW
jgi:hypothetical protein